MKIWIRENGMIALVITDQDQKIIRDQVAGTDLSPREVVEALAERHTANLQQDIIDLLADMEEENA